jgi:hypothetical protein
MDDSRDEEPSTAYSVSGFVSFVFDMCIYWGLFVL